METSDFYYVNVVEAPRHFRQASSRQALGLTKAGLLCKVTSNDLAKFDSYQDAEAFLKNVKKSRSSGNSRYPAAGKYRYQVRYCITPGYRPDTASRKQVLLNQNL